MDPWGVLILPHPPAQLVHAVDTTVRGHLVAVCVARQCSRSSNPHVVA